MAAREIWRFYKELLEQRKYEEWWNTLWIDDGKLVIAYGKAGEPFKAELYKGKAEILGLIADPQGNIKSIQFFDDEVCEADNNIFFATFSLSMKTRNEFPYTYNNYIICKFILRQ